MSNRAISGKSGTSSYITKKYASLFLIPLFLWFVCVIYRLITADVAGAHAVLISPINIGLSIFFVLTAFVSFSYDFDEMIQDYISCAKKRFAIMTCYYFVVGIAVVLFLLSIIYLHILVRITTLM